MSGSAVHLKVTADVSASDVFSVSVFCADGVHTDITYDKTKGTISFDRSKSGIAVSYDRRERSKARVRSMPYAPENDTLVLEIFLDRSSVEVFFGEGELTMTSLSYNPVGADGIRFSSVGETALVIEKQDIIVG